MSNIENWKRFLITPPYPVTIVILNDEDTPSHLIDETFISASTQHVKQIISICVEKVYDPNTQITKHTYNEAIRKGIELATQPFIQFVSVGNDLLKNKIRDQLYHAVDVKDFNEFMYIYAWFTDHVEWDYNGKKSVVYDTRITFKYHTRLLRWDDIVRTGDHGINDNNSNNNNNSINVNKPSISTLMGQLPKPIDCWLFRKGVFTDTTLYHGTTGNINPKYCNGLIKEMLYHDMYISHTPFFGVLQRKDCMNCVSKCK